MKKILPLLLLLSQLKLFAQTCYSISNRTNGNGNPGTCGTPNCSGDVKTGHIDVDFGASCPGTIPDLTLIAVTSGALPSPFCFDRGNCISAGTVRYCFRGSNLPNSGSMTLNVVQGASSWTCSYDVNGGGGTILPVQLVSFDAKLKEGKVILNWRTAQETNTDEFIIERSRDGLIFTETGRLKAQGNSTIPVDYIYTDNMPEKGVAYYRLRQTDIDGKNTFSGIKRVDNRIEGIELISLFPNPVNSQVNLRLFISNAGTVRLRLTNQSGQQIIFFEKTLATGEQNWMVKLPSLPGGVYQLFVSNKSGQLIAEKLVIKGR